MADHPDYLAPYRDAVDEHGGGFEATLWGSREAQLLRFDVFADLADFQQCTIVDAGCGPGDLAAHLIAREIDFGSYIGLDAVPEMIEAARQRRIDPDRVRFETADLVADPTCFQGLGADWICFSGTLNTMTEPTAQALIATAFAAAAQGVAFNFLSNRCHARWADRILAPATRFDTAAWLDWALDRTSRVAFTQDYLDGHDATIVLRHD
ncbi:MAG: class I SAM-dependent methyltransferase [Planctomycetota bacterium]